MNFTSKSVTGKTVTGALAAALLSTAIATPAEARHRGYRHDRSGISLGDVVLGTIAVAGVATVVGALSKGNRYDRGYDDRRYDGRTDGRAYDGRDGYGGYGGRSGYRDDKRGASDACTYAAQREADRRFGSSARVDVRDVDRSRDGYTVRGTVEARDGYGRERYYDRDARVGFTCSTRYGEVTGLRLGNGYARGY